MQEKKTNVVYDKDGKPLDKKVLKKMLEEAEEAEFIDVKDVRKKDVKEEGNREPINPALAEDDARKKEIKTIKVNIACGQQKQDGYIGIDKIKTPAVDIVHDLDIFSWPFEDSSVDEVVCSHYIEHTKDLIKFMDELCRIMKVGAKATIIAPYYSSIRCWQDPTHVRAISEYTFLYFNKKWREDNKLDHYGIVSDFDFVYGYSLDPAWANRSEEARVFAMKHYWNVISDIHVTLTKR